MSRCLCQNPPLCMHIPHRTPCQTAFQSSGKDYTKPFLDCKSDTRLLSYFQTNVKNKHFWRIKLAVSASAVLSTEYKRTTLQNRIWMFLRTTSPCIIRNEYFTSSCLYIVKIPWKMRPFWKSGWLCQNKQLDAHIRNRTSRKTGFESSDRGLLNGSFGLQTVQGAAYKFLRFREKWAHSGGQKSCVKTRRLVCIYLMVSLLLKLHLKAPGTVY